MRECGDCSVIWVKLECVSEVYSNDVITVDYCIL